jgi:hypothetical protein
MKRKARTRTKGRREKGKEWVEERAQGQKRGRPVE